jgi:hypothetical protein
MSQLRRGLIAAAVYILCILAATLYTFQLSEPPVGTVATLTRLLPLQIVLIAICVIVVRRAGGWRACGFARLRWPALVWRLPSVVVMGAMAANLVPSLRAGAFAGLDPLAWPLVIWHAVWNLLVFASQIAGVQHGFVLIGVLIQAAISVWLWQDIRRKGWAQR